jgi:threonine synthase
MSSWRGIIARYGERLQIGQNIEPVTLMEGNTPLIPSQRLVHRIAPGGKLFFKYEGLNPTGSFKDRGMTTAMTQAVADGARSVICASTGNTAASAAAYAARAGLSCIVLIPDGKIAVGKLAGALAYGAQIVSITGSFDDGLRMVREVAERMPIALVNSVNPARIQGQKTAAWEVTEQIGRVPDWLCLPVGNAGNITAYWLGFNEDGKGKPRLLGAQAAGAAPLVLGHPVDRPETRATAIRIGNPARWTEAVTALEESNGHILAVTDDQIFEAYHLLAKEEGIFCEPSSAAGVAGLIQSVKGRRLDSEGTTIVCVLTGHGLKDPDSAVSELKDPVTIPPITDCLLKILDRSTGVN